MSKNIYNKYGVNINNESMFINMPGISGKDKKLVAIRAFSSSDILFKLLYLLKGFKLKRINKNELVLNYKNEATNFSIFSEVVTFDKNNFKLKRELLNPKKRVGRCHEMSIFYIGCGNYLVTGYVDDVCRDYRVIHSWIEDDKYVIDCTSNLVMKKDDYYKLRNVEVLSIINKEDVYSDIKSDFLNEFLSCKFYCLFRDELYRDGLIQYGNREIVKRKDI